MYDDMPESPFDNVDVGVLVRVKSYANVVTEGPLVRTYRGVDKEMRAVVRTGPNHHKDFGVGKILAVIQKTSP